MKVVILAGGYGTRISEETSVMPKPMVRIGEEPILWHIMKIYSHYGINDFVICCGYKGHVIKDYFANFFLHRADVTFDLENNRMDVHKDGTEPWKITLIDTGDDTMTGGRLKRVKSYVEDETFCLTYGDGVSDINITDLIQFHREQGTIATVTAVQPSGRFGVFKLEAGEYRIKKFREKPTQDDAWINGGFQVLEPGVFDFIEGDDTVFEHEPMEKLAKKGELSAYRHDSFWQCMDTLRDKNLLQGLWDKPDCPWYIWKD